MKVARRCIAAAALACVVAGCSQSAPISAGGGASEPTPSPSPGTPANLLTLPLVVATPRIVPLPPAPDNAARPLSADVNDWSGERSHLAGTAHYDRGEWIYEDHPWTAYGAASAATAPLYRLLDALGGVIDSFQRVPGGLAIVLSQAGAGPLVDEADLSELRVAVRGSELQVMARTTTMLAPVRTALLLLFDTGRAGSELSVPFGAGIKTSAADTAALVTASGTRIVDLVSGEMSEAPAATDPTGYNNLIATSLPLSLVSTPGATELRMVAATGLAEPGSYQLDAGSAAGPLAKVVPRFEEPVQSTYDRRQALALASGNVDEFFVTVSLDRLRAGASEQLLPGIGYSVRTFLAPESRSSEGGTNGTLRQYGLYLPKTYADDPVPATLLFRGSSMSAHGLAAITPGLFQNLGDDNGAVVISPCGRSGFDMFQGAVYADVLQTLDDAQALLPIDADRISLAGYSMGGYATYMFAATQPERFSGAFVIEGLVGGNRPATSLLPFPDVIPMLENLLHLPVEIFQGDIDVNVPIIHALAATERLRNLGFRYRFNLLLANTHFSPGLQNDYSIGARYLKATRREASPARVLLTRSMPYERHVNSGATSDQPAAGLSMDLHFDRAWFVRDLTASDPVDGVATIDVRTFARPHDQVTPVVSSGVDTGPLTGQAASPFVEQSWRIDPAMEPLRNAFEAQLSGVAHVTLDLAGMALRSSEPLTANISTDSTSEIALNMRDGDCMTAGTQGSMIDGALVLLVPPGEHTLVLEPNAGACR